MKSPGSAQIHIRHPNCELRAAHAPMIGRVGAIMLLIVTGCTTPTSAWSQREAPRADVTFGSPVFAFRRTEELVQDAEVRVAVSSPGQMHLAWGAKRIDKDNSRRALEYDILYSAGDVKTLSFSACERVSLEENHVECDPGIAIIDHQPWVTYLSSSTSYLAKRKLIGGWTVAKLHPKQFETDFPIVRPDAEGGAILAGTVRTEDGAGPAFLRCDNGPNPPLAVPVSRIARIVHLRDLALVNKDIVALAVVVWRDKDETRDYRTLIVERATGTILNDLALPVTDYLVAYRYSLHQDWLDCEGTPQLVAHGSRICAYWISQDEQWRFRLVFSVLNLESEPRWSDVRTVYTEPGRKIILHAAAVDPEGTLHFSWLAQSDDRLWSVYYASSSDWSTTNSMQRLQIEPFQIEAWPGYRRTMAADGEFVYLAWPMRSRNERGVMVCIGQYGR